MRKYAALLFIFAAAFFCGLAFLPFAGSQQVVPALPVQQAQIIPPGSSLNTAIPWSQTGSSGGAAAITLTQGAAPGKTAYCTGIEIMGGGATAGSVVVCTLASGGTTIANFAVDVPTGVAVSANPIFMTFNPPIVGLGPGQNMVLTVPSFGAGNTGSSANMRGFYQ